MKTVYIDQNGGKLILGVETGLSSATTLFRAVSRAAPLKS